MLLVSVHLKVAKTRNELDNHKLLFLGMWLLVMSHS